MQWKNCGRRLLAAIGALTCMSLAMQAQAQCVGYTAAPGPATFVSGVDDVGNHGDDVVTNIALPFAVTFYGTTYNSANVVSNGFLEFTAASAAFGNICPIPSTATQGPAIFPFWDDQRTDATVTGTGIFTTTTGVSPNQKFIIEWRTYYYGTTPAAFTQNYEIIFSEGQGNFDVVYGTTFADRASATIGCQDGAGVFTSYSCNTAGPAAGTSLRFSCIGANIAGACCNPAAGTCNVATSATCVGAGNFQGIGTTCPANCAQPGACCNTTTGVCSQTGITGCTAPSTFSGVGTLCTPNPCVGACCNPTTGACTLTTAIGCASPNTFQGLGMVCSPNPCPRQACCNSTSGACTLAGPATGACPSGTTGQGVGTSCTPNNCPQQACCNPLTGACSVSGSSTCPSGTTGQGVGTSCAVNPCPQPPPPANDNCADVVTANAPRVPGAGGVVTGNNSAATTDGAATCGGSGTKDVYFLFTPTVGGDWQFSTCTTLPTFDTLISVHSGCPADITTLLGCDDDGCGFPLSKVIVTGLSAGVQVIVRVADYGTAASAGGIFTLTVGQVETGACCNAASGACTSTTVGAAGCASGTTYQGQGTSCTPNICVQPPTGACCNNTTGACTQVFSFNCSSATSTFSGNNTTCDASGFCTAAGTCCTSLGNCVTRFVATCPSGLTSNPALTCTPGLCPSIGASICQNFDAGTVGSLPNNWTSTSTGAGAPWVIDSAQSNSAPNAVFTNDVPTVSTQILQLPAVTAGGTLTLDFLSFYTTEATFDGWVVEFSTDAGATWTDVVVGGSWVLNGYNQAAISVNFASPIAGRPAFSGAGAVWTDHIATINATNGQSVIIRFLMASDSSVTSIGVWLDNICIGGIQSTVSGVCCRGATCTTTVLTSAACTASLIPGQTAGASFPTSAGCNAAVLSNTPCCYADYNKLNGITVTDIFNFLTDWFAGSPYANVGGTGAPGPLAVQNIFDFLSNWFAGGC